MIKIVNRSKGFGANRNERVSRKRMVSESLIEDWELVTKKNQNKVDWEAISIDQKLPEDFIREFEDKVDWYWISQWQNLSEEFIREFQDEVDWDMVSRYQRLSEDFIREFQDRVDWKLISEYQHLYEDFIREFQHKVDLEKVLQGRRLPDYFRKEIEHSLKTGEPLAEESNESKKSLRSKIESMRRLKALKERRLEALKAKRRDEYKSRSVLKNMRRPVREKTEKEEDPLEKEYKIYWSVDYNSEDMLIANAEYEDVELDWDKINDAIYDFERNGIFDFIQGFGLTNVRLEGHDNDNAVGYGLIKGKDLIDLMSDADDTFDGYYQAVFHRSSGFPHLSSEIIDNLDEQAGAFDVVSGVEFAEIPEEFFE